MFRYDTHRVFWRQQFQHVLVMLSGRQRSLFKQDTSTESWKHHRSPTQGKWEFGICTVLFLESSLPPCATCHTSTELPTRKSLHTCLLLLWPNIAEDAPVTSGNILPRNLLAWDWVCEVFFLSSKSSFLWCHAFCVARQAPLSMGFPGKNTGVGRHSLLQGFFLDPELNLCLLHWQVASLPLNHQGNPF